MSTGYINKLKGYVINLSRMPERLTQFNQNPHAQYFERVEAIDELQLPASELNNLLFNQSYFEEVCQRKVALGEIACTLSHILCWQKIAQNEELTDTDYAIIAEDDIVLNADFEEIINLLIDHIQITKKDYECIILHKLGLKDFRFEYPNQNQYHILDNLNINDVIEEGSALYLFRKDRAKALIAFLAERKPYWLADQFSQFCPLEKIAILYPYLGYINDNSKSDLSAERSIVEKELIERNKGVIDKMVDQQ